MRVSRGPRFFRTLRLVRAKKRWEWLVRKPIRSPSPASSEAWSLMSTGSWDRMAAYSSRRSGSMMIVMTRILVVANQTLGCPELEEALAPYTEGDAEMVVVAPISVSEGESQWDYPPIDRYIPSAEQIAHALAGGRLEHELDRLRRLGVTARGEIVDHDPVGRVRELLGESEFDAVLVCTLPTRLSRWLRMDLPGRLARAVTAPVVHVPGSAGPSL
jgi:nucleotide-binding universal stress UspA family protein